MVFQTTRLVRVRVEQSVSTVTPHLPPQKSGQLFLTSRITRGHISIGWGPLR